MVAHLTYALVYNNIVQNVFVCNNYQAANDLAKGCFGNEAFAIDITYCPTIIGDIYENGFFYRMINNEKIKIDFVPTEQEEIKTLKRENEVSIKTLRFMVNSLTDEQAVQVSSLFPVWEEGKEYKVGDRVTDEFCCLFKAVANHTSQEGDMENIEMMNENGKTKETKLWEKLG